MLRYEVNEHGVFIAAFEGVTSIEHLTLGLRACIHVCPNQTKAVWDLSSMQVAFTSDEVRDLMVLGPRRDIAPGRMAYVTGVSRFKKALVDLTGAFRPEQVTEWRAFTDRTEAVQWIISDTK